MIQRVQTLYLAIAIILLGVVSAGAALFHFVGDGVRYTFSSFGILETNLADGTAIDFRSMPMFIGTIALLLLCFLCLMSYKNLNRQFKLGRMIFGLYFLGVVGVLLFSIYGDSLLDGDAFTREMGIGFILFITGFPFIFLANLGVKRDKRLLESLDRLR